jgi:hypothetical protein
MKSWFGDALPTFVHVVNISASHLIVFKRCEGVESRALNAGIFVAMWSNTGLVGPELILQWLPSESRFSYKGATSTTQ